MLIAEEEHSAYVKIDSKVTNALRLNRQFVRHKKRGELPAAYAYQAYKVLELQIVVGRISFHAAFGMNKTRIVAINRGSFELERLTEIATTYHRHDSLQISRDLPVTRISSP